MIIISPLLDSYFRNRLKSKAFRHAVYKKAIEHKLRHSKAGHIILRNLGELMAANKEWHNEFSDMVGAENYQKCFWESDLGYLWYLGNLNAQNKYFEFALEEIKKNSHQSVLDVGCGWGRFCKQVVEAGVKNCKGIDISEQIIEQAKSKFPEIKNVFEHKDVMKETGNYDLITLFGSTDYIPPLIYEDVLRHLVQHANKEIIIVNSLRGIPIEKALGLSEAMEIKRYDDGFLQATNHLLNNIQKTTPFSFTISKFGSDSIMAVVRK